MPFLTMKRTDGSRWVHSSHFGLMTGYEAITPPAIMHASECAANLYGDTHLGRKHR